MNGGKKNGDQTEAKFGCGKKWIESEPPPVSIQYHTNDGSIDRGLNNTNHMPGVGGRLIR